MTPPIQLQTDKKTMKPPRLVLGIVALFACQLALAQGEATVVPGSALRSNSVSPAPAAPAPVRPPSATVVVPLPDPATEPRIIRGNDRLIAAPPPVAPLGGAANSFRFEEAPIAEVVHTILRDIVKVDYMIHPPISGNVTLATRGRVSADQAVYLLESALLANGMVMARDSRGTYHVGRPEALRGIVPVPRLAGAGPLPPGTGAVVVPLDYIGAAEMATILRPLLPPEALVRVDTTRNLLVLAGNRAQTEGWLSIVSTFDVDFLKGMSVGLYPLKYASVREVEAALRAISSGGRPGAAGPAAPPGQGTTAPGASAPAGLSESIPLFGGVRIMPIERLNSVLVVSPRASYLEDAQRWIERLDRPGTNVAEQSLHVYPVQNGSARHLAEVLNNIFGGGDGRGAGVTAAAPARAGVAPALFPSTGATGSSVGGMGLGGGTALGGQVGGGLAGMVQQGQGSARPAGAPGVLQLGALRVAADEANNAILVWGTAAEYAKIETTLRRLDLPPTQVLIEASIVEVTLAGDLRYGLQWVFNDGLSGGRTGSSVLSAVAGGVLGGPAAGFSYTLRNSLGNVRAVLNALAEKSLIKVISSPSLMVLDNHTAQIVVGDQQPVRSAETITDGGVRTSSIQYKDTGVALSVTPSVNSGNMVTMLVNQAVTDVGAIDEATGQRAFLQRQIGSKVAIRSGETLVLGGLIRDNTTSGSAGIPVLHDIPVLGALFGSKSANDRRTELLVIITPRVVRSDQDAREVSAELKERMQSFIGHVPFGVNAPTGPPVTPTLTQPGSSLYVPSGPNPTQ